MLSETSRGRYVFISNSTKPSPEEAESRALVPAYQYQKPCLALAQELGYEVYLGVNRNRPEELRHEMGIQLYDSHTYRSLTDIRSNATAFRNFLNLLRKGDFKVIHCNTPIGGVIGRLGGLLMGVDKVIYTAHGFHFYEGAPLFNRTVLKAAERVLARCTDAIITMNEEDYRAAQQFKLRKKGKAYFVHGVGLKVDRFAQKTVDREAYRRKLGFSEEDLLLIAAGDLIKRKNYETSIRALAQSEVRNAHLLVCGMGPEQAALEELTEQLGLKGCVHFLGFRSDMKELLEVSDILLFSSRQEGMPRSMMEAMATGLPCLASRIRGNVDILEEGKGGYLYHPDDVQGFAAGIEQLAQNPELRREMGAINQTKIQPFDEANVKQELAAIYREVLGQEVL